MDNWNDARAGRMALYVIGGLAAALFVMLMGVVFFAGQQPAAF
jgi:hypothetical protein